MKCKLCKERAVYPDYCKKHFIKYFEKKVESTIKKYKLITKKDKVMIAVSGGKDSIAVMYLVNKLFGNVTGLAIDEGISEYREHTLNDLKKFCKENKIPLKIYSFKKEFGMHLDEMVNKTKLKPCHICGILRRYLLNKYSRKFDKIVTGHNLDDEAQSILVNIFRGNPELLSRLGPSTGINEYKKYFTQRVKPLYFIKEKEVMVYSILKKFGVRFVECKHAGHSYRSSVRDLLNDYEVNNIGAKANIAKHFLKLLPSLKKKYKTIKEPNLCKKCKQPARGVICKTCEILDMVK